MKNKAFTLVELLVAILIIGILAAIAYPQYQKAVLKSRYAVLKNITRAIADAQEIYYIENGVYASRLDELSVNFPAGNYRDDQIGLTERYYYPWGNCLISAADEKLVACANEDINMQFRIYYKNALYKSGNVYCFSRGTAATSSSLQSQICKAETGHSNPDINNEGFEMAWKY